MGALEARERGRAIAGVIVILAVTGLAIKLLMISSLLAAGIAAAIVGSALMVWLWQNPVRGVYVLFGASVMLDAQFPAIKYKDDVGSYLPFFQDISSWTHVHGISVSLNELFMALLLLIWLLKGIAERSLHFEKGSLMRPLGLFMLMVLVGEFRGISSGGNFHDSLWEIRSQVYMLVAYIAACNLIKTRFHVHVLTWILIIGAGLKGIQGVYRYQLELHGDLGGAEALFAHEQSFFFNAFLTLAIILFLYEGSRRMRRTVLWLMPFVIYANLANNRRAAIVAIAVAVFAALLVTLIVHAPSRVRAAVTLLILAVVLPPYYLYYQNKDGTLAKPARAIASNFNPSPRDAASNLYRDNENKDILATMQTSPIIGVGFGKRMLTPYKLADISQIYEFWNLLPHNSILWIWMRLGIIGYLLFWMLIGTAMVQSIAVMRRLKDPYLRGLALFILLMVMQEVIFGYLDLQWTNYRNLITIGILFALISRLEALPSEAETAPPDADIVVEVRRRSARTAKEARTRAPVGA